MAVTQQILSTTVTIANGASLSGAATLGEEYTLHAVEFPAAWTAAALTFQISRDGGATFMDLYDFNGEFALSSTVAGTSRVVALEPYRFLRVDQVKLRSGTAAAAVNQGGARVLTLYYSPI